MLQGLGLIAVLFVGLVVIPRLLPARQAALVGKDAPDFDLALVANQARVAQTDAAQASADAPSSLRLHDLRGSAVLLDFWATWCPPCRAEAPIVNDVARRWRDRGVVVVGVDADTLDQGDPHAFAVSHGLGYPIVRDLRGTAMRAYAVEGLPTLVVVSRTGKVVAVRTGVTDDGEIESLLRLAL